MMERDIHEPSAEFRDRLEMEIRRALRSQPAAQQGKTSPWRWARNAAAILIAVLTGFGSGLLSAQVQQNRSRASLLATEAAELRIASERLELAQTILAQARTGYNAGITGRETVSAAEKDVERMLSGVERRRLNVEEIEATGIAPRDDLAAPVVRGRDFVAERLLPEIVSAQKQLTLLEEELRTRQMQLSSGTISNGPVLELQADHARARAALEALVGKREVRERFVGGALTPEAVAREVTRLELSAEVKMVDTLHQLATQRFSTLQVMHQARRIPEVEVLRVQLEVSELELQRQNLQQSLDALGR